MNSTILFIILALSSGVVSGLVYAGLNFAIVEPYIDKAIEIEVANLIAEGEEVDLNEVNAYRAWQKGGSVLASIMYGIGFASLFTIIYAFARNGLKGSEAARGLILAFILWLVLWLVPFIKYPANPPAVGDPDTIYYRQALYISLLAISGVIALILAIAYKRFDGIKRHRVALPIIYALAMIGVFIAMPNNPDEISIDNNLLSQFRGASIAASLLSWLTLGLAFGVFFDRLKARIVARYDN